VAIHQGGLTLSWTPPAYELDTVEIDGEPYSQLHLPGLTSAGLPGKPELPLYSGLIGLPATGEARLRIVEVERETVSLSHQPLPAPVPQPVHLAPTELDPALAPNGPSERLPDTQIYATDTFYPAAMAELRSPQQVRNRPVASLIIHPLRVNPVSRQLEVIRFLRLEVTFTDPAATSLSSQQVDNDPFSRALGAALLNPAAVQWPAATQLGPAQVPVTLAAAGQETKVLVDEAGLYALSYTDLQNAGLPVNSLDPRTFRLTHGYPRQEVAIYVEGESDGGFNASDQILFYAAPAFSRYVDYDVYLLSYGGVNGLRMTTRSGSPSGLAAGQAWRTATAEANQFYDPLYPGRDGDHWYWDKLFQPDDTSGSYAIGVEKPLTSGPNATLTLWLQGYTDPGQNPDHKVSVAVNGTFIGETTWNGAIAVEAAFSVSSSLLVNGQNQVSLTLPGVGTVVEGMWLDALALKFPTGQAGSGQLRFEGEANQRKYTLTGWSTTNLSVYDVTDAEAPQRVTGYQLSGSSLSIGDVTTTPARYLVVPSSQVKTPLALQAAAVFNDPAGGGDYIIITPAGLSNALTPLANHRTSQGLRVVSAEVNTIYDTFGAGRLDPVAIKNFLNHAYQNWPDPAPLYVLLVGDGAYDFKNYSGYNAQTLIPPYLAQVDPWWGETAADNRYVTLVGGDNLPDLFIGRLTVNNAAEATDVVNKIITYETNPAAGMWNSRQLFVADNPDGAGNFHHNADLAYQEVQPPFVGYRFYYDHSGTQPYIFTDAQALQTSFIAYLNSGASLVSFHGHSSWLQWAIEDLFHVDNVDQLSNNHRLPVVLEMTCFTGFFHHPAYPNTLDETLLRQSGGGAVAVWGSTGLGVSTGHDALQAGFYQAVIRQGETNLGAAVMAGKLKLYATGLNLDLLDTYTLFGDPALTMYLTVTPTNYTDTAYLPLILH
jgi:hypothetical protein